jgi:ATP-dependent Lhr-like helicase
VARVITQLQGFQAAAGAWERELLPARLHSYDPSWLDALCLAGELAWCRLTPRARPEPSDADGGAAPSERTRVAPSRATPLGLLRRADATWLRAGAASLEPAAAAAPLDDDARVILTLLGERGASFLADLVEQSGLPPDAVEDALWQLVAAGLVTADGFASLRVLVDRRRGETRSHFDDVAAPPHASAAAPPRKWLDAVKKARGRDQARPRHAVRALPTAGGRWARLPDPAAAGDDVAEAWARQLLARYGVVFRDLLARENALPPWRDLLVALRRLEARGEIRGGRFVSGFVGEQFALPEAVEGLRAARHGAGASAALRLAATDPLNLAGVLSPGARVPAVAGNALLIVDGVVVATREAGVVTRRPELPPGAIVDDDLAYTPPPPPSLLHMARPDDPTAQTALRW